MQILFSIPQSSCFLPPEGDVDGNAIAVSRRHSDWGLSGLRKKWHHVKEAFRICREASRYDVAIVSTVGQEAFIIGALRRFLCRKTKIVLFDFLMPRPTRIDAFMGLMLRGIDRIAVIRTGDQSTLTRRFRYPVDACQFISFPGPTDLISASAVDEGYIYSAGWAHRDWPTLIKALEALPYPAKLSPGRPVSVSPSASHIEILPMQSPEQGRELMAKAAVVVLAMLDTDLPSGPLVLLDAMAMGKGVVATSVNGTRDYTVPGKTAIMIPPGEVDEMKKAIVRLMTNPEDRNAMGQAARRHVETVLALDTTLSKLLAFAGEARNIQSLRSR